MKHTKRFLLTLALAFTGVLASWAQDEVTVNTTANANEWTLQMPDADVELEVTYYTDEEAPFIDGVELTANSDGTWSLAEMPGFDIELEVEYYTDEEVNQMAADEVITKINAIGTVEYTDACKALIDAAREAYDALTDAQKALVSEETLKVLTDAEAAYAELKAAAEETEKFAVLIYQVGEQSSVRMTVKKGDVELDITAEEGWTVEALTVNGTDQKENLTEGKLTVNVDADTEVNVTFCWADADNLYTEDTASGIATIEGEDVKVYAKDGQICVDGAAGKLVRLYTISGQAIASATPSAGMTGKFSVPAGTYIVRVGLKAAKIVVK